MKRKCEVNQLYSIKTGVICDDVSINRIQTQFHCDEVNFSYSKHWLGGFELTRTNGVTEFCKERLL